MAIAVHKLLNVVDGRLTVETPLPGNFGFKMGDVSLALTGFISAADAEAPPFAPGTWEFPVVIGDGKRARQVLVPLHPFIGRSIRERAAREPVSLLETQTPSDERRWLWLYRDAIWVTSRNPRLAEVAEVVLRIKAGQFREDEELKRLKEQVANLEAVETLRNGIRVRAPIPDDVKLLVWSRDGGACVRCGSRDQLQFDHVIPHSRGGSDSSENIQVLCQGCNLAKRANLA